MESVTYNLKINDCTLADAADVSFTVKDTKSKPAKLTVKGKSTLHAPSSEDIVLIKSYCCEIRQDWLCNNDFKL